MATRRWYYYVPASGSPRGLVHAIESHNLDELPGDKVVYAGREQLAAGLQQLLKGAGRVAMEYSPGNAIPTCPASMRARSRPCAQFGTDRRVVRRSGPALRSDLDRRGFGHAPRGRRAALPHQGSRLRDGPRSGCRRGPRQRDRSPGGDGRLVPRRGSRSPTTPPNVSAQENAGNPHYQATQAVHRAIRPNERVLIDLWGKLPTPGAVYADITWIGFTGANPPEDFSAAFAAARDGRDAAVDLVAVGGACRPGAPGLRSRPRLSRGGRARRLRGAVHPPYRTQPRRERARQRRPHGRLRDA